MKDNNIKDSRLEIRLSSKDKEKLKVIASIRGLKVSELVYKTLFDEFEDNSTSYQ